MHFADLTDTPFSFSCDFAGDAVDYWDFDFTARYKDEQYYRSLTRDELLALRDNCNRILEAIGGL